MTLKQNQKKKSKIVKKLGPYKILVQAIQEFKDTGVLLLK